MALKIANPDNVPREVTTGYQAQNTVLFASMTGYANINISSTGIISEGSLVEVNGVLFRCIENETVDNVNSIPLNSIFYIYAMPITEDIVSFTASTITPQWYTTKGGYYSSENNRAIIRAVRDSNGLITGVTLMTRILSSQVYANSGGVLSYSKNVRAHESVNFNPGWYRFELASGAGGGNGGNAYGNANGGMNGGGRPAGSYGGGGGVPSVHNTYSNVFYHQGGNMIIHIGGNGFNGEAGLDGVSESIGGGYASSTGGGGGGGGGGAGEESYILSGSNKLFAPATNSGNGGNGGASGGVLVSTGINKFSYAGGNGGNKSALPGNAMFGTNGFGGGGGGGGVGPGATRPGQDNNTYYAGANGSDGGGGGAPGWNRNYSDGAAGYCNIYFLGE